jgi:hypothetical protein
MILKHPYGMAHGQQQCWRALAGQQWASGWCQCGLMDRSAATKQAAWVWCAAARSCLVTGFSRQPAEQTTLTGCAATSAAAP